MHIQCLWIICKERIQKFKETGDSRYIYQNKLDKAFFQHAIVCGDFKDLARRTASDKILRDKGFNITKNPKDDRYQGGLASLVQKFSDKKNQVEQLEMRILQTKNQLKNYSKQLLKKNQEKKSTLTFYR